jgi:hypothetical protein
VPSGVKGRRVLLTFKGPFGNPNETNDNSDLLSVTQGMKAVSKENN